MPPGWSFENGCEFERLKFAGIKYHLFPTNQSKMTKVLQNLEESKDINASDALRLQIENRNKHLSQISAELKNELFGIDDAIDRVIDAMRAWYVLPELMERPLIICLWGLTGTGKSQLIRSISKKIGFYNRYIEIQIDGSSNGGQYNSKISSMLKESEINDGEPGILVLDEFQHFRTIGKQGEDIKQELYKDVWALLSDGILPPSCSLFNSIEDLIVESQYERERSPVNVNGEKYKFLRTSDVAERLKNLLKLKDPIVEIMAWPVDKVRLRLTEFRKNPSNWNKDYTNLLVFVSGNLDELYEDIANSGHDCDTDADIFHELTNKISVIDVKKSLAKRFKAEQIARLGNEHIIFPSLNRSTYERLIDSTCASYINKINEKVQLTFCINQNVKDEIYNNGVFPVQGARPLLSSIQAILSAPLTNGSIWAIRNGAILNDRINIFLDRDKSSIHIQFNDKQISYPVKFEIKKIREKLTLDIRSLLAVHEAGHSLVYGLLFCEAPMDCKINLASFNGGYTMFKSAGVLSRQQYLDKICVGLAGRAAEIIVFGLNATTAGASGDLREVTEMASKFVRSQGFDQRLSKTDIAISMDDNINTDIESTNQRIEEIMLEQHERATGLIKNNIDYFMKIVKELIDFGCVSSTKFSELMNLQTAAGNQDHIRSLPYANYLANFERDNS